ncbi:MAG: alpha/beta hydrolase [Pseudomonadota bacterium]|nr:alpha/beta hydrolase [Pseudomonadota bacterium]
MLRALFLTTLAACAPRYAGKGAIEPEDLWSPLPRQHVTVMGTDVAYVDSGGSGPPLVFVHGLSSSVGFWEYQIPAFAHTNRVLALDLPGYGSSARPDAPCTPPWYASVVAAWLDAVGVDRATIVGHSMGGQIAIHLALGEPARVERLVLSAPAGLEPFQPGAAKFMKDFWTERRALGTTEEQVRANFTTQVFNRRDAGVERMIEERVRLGLSPRFAGTSVAVSRSVAGMLDYPVLERLGQIVAPTLVIFGTADRMIPNPVFNGGSTRAVARVAETRIPNAKVVLIPGAGHTVHHDAPEAFNAALQEFLR